MSLPPFCLYAFTLPNCVTATVFTEVVSVALFPAATRALIVIGPSERGESERRRGRIAAGRAHDRDRGVAETGQLRAVELREPVHRGLEKVRSGVVEAVPGRIVGGVPEAEVGAEVDDRRARVDERAGHRRRGAVRQGEEHRVDRRQVFLDR